MDVFEIATLSALCGGLAAPAKATKSAAADVAFFLRGKKRRNGKAVTAGEARESALYLSTDPDVPESFRRAFAAVIPALAAGDFAAARAALLGASEAAHECRAALTAEGPLRLLATTPASNGNGKGAKGATNANA